MNTSTTPATFTTTRVLFQKTGENVGTPADPIRPFVEGTDEALLSVMDSFCLSFDDDRLVRANKYESYEVTLPSWLSAAEWVNNTTGWKYTWGCGVDPTWSESWQRALYSMSMEERMVTVKLLKTKNFRSDFRKSLHDQIVAWMETPVESRQFRSPLSRRQWDALISAREVFAAKRLGESLYRYRSIDFGAPKAA